MINITENAQKELDKFFETHTEAVKSIRIYLAPGGCCGPSLNMALDSSTPEDMIEEVAGITYCISPDLSAMTGEISLDVSYMGFTLTPEIPLPGGACGSTGCSGCGTGTSGCGS